MANYGPMGYGTYSCSYAGTSLCDSERCGSYDRCQGTGDWSGHTVAQQEKIETEEKKNDNDNTK